MRGRQRTPARPHRALTVPKLDMETCSMLSRALLRWLRSGVMPGRLGGVISSRSGSSAPAGYRFPREVIAVAVRWYLRYGLSYRDVEELLAERGVEVDHVSVYRWVQTFPPEFIDAAGVSRHAVGDRLFVDETYVKVAGRRTYLYRAVDQYGQVLDVLVSKGRDRAAARAFITRAKRLGPAPTEVATDRAPVYPRVIEDLLRGAWPVLQQYANNAVDADHGRLKARLGPMHELTSITSLSIVAGRARIRTEPAPRSLRTHRRPARPRSSPGSVHRAR